MTWRRSQDVPDYQSALRLGLDERKGRNPSYSLRAYARDINVSVSFLSEVIRYKQNFSESLARSVAKKIYFDSEDQEFFFQLYRLTCGKGFEKQQAKKILHRLSSSRVPHRLEESVFDKISSWVHFAILEYLRVNKTYSSHNELNTAFNLSREQVSSCLKDLIECELVTDEDGYLKPIHDQTISENFGRNRKTVRSFHRSFIKKAIETQDLVSPEFRDISGVIFSLNKNDLSKFSDKIRILQKEFMDEGYKKAGNSLYGLTIQLFPLTTPSEFES